MLVVRALLAVSALAVALSSGIARGQTCSFSAGATPIAFGAYDPGTAIPNDSTGSFRYTCTSAKVKQVIVALSAGGAGSFNPRQMALGAERLDYNLYSDAARTVIWGDGTGGSQTVTSTPAGATHGATVTIYGRIGAGQWVPPGGYTDTIAVTVFF
jgi:spore coat protein U-like protein